MFQQKIKQKIFNLKYFTTINLNKKNNFNNYLIISSPFLTFILFNFILFYENNFRKYIQNNISFKYSEK